MRCTKIAGVTTYSGLIAPTGTISSTSTIVVVAAIAIIGIEIARRKTVSQIAKLVGCFGFDESVVGMNRHLEDAAFSFDDALFFPSRDFRAHTDGCIKRAKTSGGSAHAFTKNSLRHEFESHLFCGELLLKIIGMRARKGCDDMADLAVFEHQAKFAIARSAIVADGGDVFDVLPGQCLDQIVGKSRAAEAAEHDSSSVSNIGHGRIQTGINFVFHGSAYPTRGGASLQVRARGSR